MFRNDLKITWRQLKKQKMYAAVKIGGFALSIAACLLIALYIRDELSYDRSYLDVDRIYRLIEQYQDNRKVEKGWSFPAPLAKIIREDFPEVENTARLMPSALFDGAGSNQIRSTAVLENAYEDKFAYADQSLLDILKIPMIYGSRAAALAEPKTMVLTKTMADKYFPHQNPVGKTMILNENKERIYKIGGVIADFPATSHFPFHFLLTLTGHELWPGEQVEWRANNYSIYTLLKKGTDPAVLQRKFKRILTQYYLPALKSSGAKDPEVMIRDMHMLLQPLTDVHLKSVDIDDWQSKGDIRFVWLFGAVAGFILIIACINFINLSTARSANRAKEVGLRKVVGSRRSGLIRQFLTESILYSFASFLLGMLVAVILLPYFNHMAAKTLIIPWSSWWLLPLLVLGTVIIGIVAGLYPAFYLSSFKPVKVLKGTLAGGSKSSFLRNGLVVFQFATSVTLIVCTLVVYRQTQYLLNRNAGFNKDQILLLQGTGTLDAKNTLPRLKSELLNIAQVKQVSVSDYLPVSGTKRDRNPFFKEGKTKEETAVGGQKWYVDVDYIKTMGMQLAAGRDFSKALVSDSAAAIINEAMVKALALKGPAVGQRITNAWETFTIVGVVKDFNFETMRQQVEPLCLALGRFNPSSIVAVKLSPEQLKHTIASITAVWQKFAPNQPIRYTFLDEHFARMYADVQRMGTIFSSFAVLAILIACLGLFALSAFMAEQRTKEIGVRKVLGAGIGNLMILLSKDFVKLVLIALLIATPFAWWIMGQWLQDFAYRISISSWMFLLAGILVIAVALITISFQSAKAALANPVKSLRTE
ncbi:ABC transporter permease [Niabella sp. CC-SYL272]|uniref:ABC transporter permease n=1 Tax=Niabella agricola TaxID=2891571 RepID=UPI001F303543|nr:ABC transporter permease [Niabella agricola]MCF3107468.1 ABC transporter permease [Niabella agricola]